MLGDSLPILFYFNFLAKKTKIKKHGQEESLGCDEARFRLTDGWGNPRESATENRLPAHTFLF